MLQGDAGGYATATAKLAQVELKQAQKRRQAVFTEVVRFPCTLRRHVLCWLCAPPQRVPWLPPAASQQEGLRAKVANLSTRMASLGKGIAAKKMKADLQAERKMVRCLSPSVQWHDLSVVCVRPEPTCCVSSMSAALPRRFGLRRWRHKCHSC